MPEFLSNRETRFLTGFLAGTFLAVAAIYTREALVLGVATNQEKRARFEREIGGSTHLPLADMTLCVNSKQNLEVTLHELLRQANRSWNLPSDADVIVGGAKMTVNPASTNAMCVLRFDFYSNSIPFERTATFDSSGHLREDNRKRKHY